MIPPKVKPCKGTGQAKGNGCGMLTMYRAHGLGKMCGCYSSWLLNSDAGRLKLNKALNKVQKPRIELETAKKDKDNRTELKRALDLTKKVVHEYVRLRDKGRPCISCGEEWNPDFQAGHYHKSELYTSLKFHLDNIHGQCVGCNIFKDGNLEQYNINLPLRIGKEMFTELQELAQIDKHQVKVWNVENLRSIRETIKSLKHKLIH